MQAHRTITATHDPCKNIAQHRMHHIRGQANRHIGGQGNRRIWQAQHKHHLWPMQAPMTHASTHDPWPMQDSTSMTHDQCKHIGWQANRHIEKTQHIGEQANRRIGQAQHKHHVPRLYSITPFWSPSMQALCKLDYLPQLLDAAHVDYQHTPAS